MKVVVCVRQGEDGNISPFDACAYEAALSLRRAEVTLLSMGPEAIDDFLLSLTRLGAKKAVRLTDKAFSGADTLATAYTLSLAIDKLKPDLIFCGRQTLIGDTAQTGPMLSEFANTALITGVMGVEAVDETKIQCSTRDFGIQSAKLPALLTFERINTLRLPSIFSAVGEVEVWNAEKLGADAVKCGLAGSPTRVIKTYENKSGRRKCTFLDASLFKQTVIDAICKKRADEISSASANGEKLDKIFVVGEEPLELASFVSDDISVIKSKNVDEISNIIAEKKPDALLFGNDSISRRLAAQVSARLGLGLCADCTRLEVEDGTLVMYRPALSGSIIAKIKSLTLPAVATLCSSQKSDDVVLAAGYGTKDNLSKIKELAQKMGAELSATRKMVDNDFLPYSMQVGLTGKKISPKVYVAVGVSGAVHHLVGMEKAAVVIAVNPDKNAPIFDYADFGFVTDLESLEYN